MILPFKEPFDFDGRKLTEIRLSDFVKPKHTLAYARVQKLLRDKGAAKLAEDFDPDNLAESDLIEAMILEVESQQILLESFAECFPREAIPEISLVDAQAIAAHIQHVFSEHERKYGSGKVPTGKKKTRAAS